MKLVYTPSYSTIFDCTPEFVSVLSQLLEHYIEEEDLKVFNNRLDIFYFTKKYAFRATKSGDLYTVELYSGFVKTVLREIYTSPFSKDFSLVSTREKYICSNNNASSYLFSHQKKIVECALKNKRGIVKSPTGSGKSYVIAELVRKLYDDNQNVLITVPTIDLLHQLTENINDYFNLAGLQPITIGKVGDGNYDFQQVTIGIPQSLSKLDKTARYLAGVDALIADEVHTCATPTYGSIISFLTNRAFSIGLSATLPNDASSIMLTAYFGDVIIQIQESEMIQNDIIMEPKFKFILSPKGFLPKGIEQHAASISSLSDQHRYKTLAQAYKYLIVNNEGRNSLIISQAIDRIKQQLGPVIVIVKQIKGAESHGEILHSQFANKGYDLPIISGYLSKKKREKILQDLRDYKIDGCIAGPKVLTAGISIPSLSTIVLGAAGKSDIDLIQRIGRLLRKKEGKERPLVIDFIDQQYWFYKQSQSRLETVCKTYGEHNVEQS